MDNEFKNTIEELIYYIDYCKRENLEPDLTDEELDIIVSALKKYK